MNKLKNKDFQILSLIKRNSLRSSIGCCERGEPFYVVRVRKEENDDVGDEEGRIGRRRRKRRRMW